MSMLAVPLRYFPVTKTTLSKVLIRNLFTELPYDSLQTPIASLRNRPFLAGCKSQNMPKYVTIKPHTNLKIVKTELDKSVLGSKSNGVRQFIDENISKTPAILIKGLPIENVEDFNSFTASLGFHNRGYESGIAIRAQLSEKVYAASDEPPEVSIEPHNEMSYIEKTPNNIMFCCLQSPKKGGVTPIVFNRDLTNALDKDILEKLTRKKIRYYRCLHHAKNADYLSWQETFRCNTEKEAEEVMKSEGIDWHWNADGTLNTWNNVPAVRAHPVTKETIFLNQVVPAHCSYNYEHPEFVDKQHLKPLELSLHTAYGDGEEIEPDVIDHIRTTTWKCAVGLKLEKGDVLFLDNFSVMHSRLSFEGDRKVLISLC